MMKESTISGIKMHQTILPNFNFFVFSFKNSPVNQTQTSNVDLISTGDSHEKTACFNASNP